MSGRRDFDKEAVMPEEGEGRRRLVTASEIARRISKSSEWVRRNVPGKIRLGHRTVRWPEDEVEEWIENGRTNQKGGE